MMKNGKNYPMKKGMDYPSKKKKSELATYIEDGKKSMKEGLMGK